MTMFVRLVRDWPLVTSLWATTIVFVWSQILGGQ